MSHELTPKQEKFAQRLVETDKPSESYRHAYDAQNMSDEAVSVEACRLQDNPSVALRIAELRQMHLKRHVVTVDRVLEEYAKLAFVDVRKLFDENGNLIPIHEMDDDTAAAIAGIEVDKKFSKMADENGEPMVESHLHKIKLSDKKGALDSLAKHLGMFVEKTEISGPGGAPLPSATLTVTPELVKTIVQQVRDEF